MCFTRAILLLVMCVSLSACITTRDTLRNHPFNGKTIVTGTPVVVLDDIQWYVGDTYFSHRWGLHGFATNRDNDFCSHHWPITDKLNIVTTIPAGEPLKVLKVYREDEPFLSAMLGAPESTDLYVQSKDGLKFYISEYFPRYYGEHGSLIDKDKRHPYYDFFVKGRDTAKIRTLRRKDKDDVLFKLLNEGEGIAHDKGDYFEVNLHAMSNYYVKGCQYKVLRDKYGRYDRYPDYRIIHTD